jgi:hypothetical protein
MEVLFHFNTDGNDIYYWESYVFKSNWKHIDELVLDILIRLRNDYTKNY